MPLHFTRLTLGVSDLNVSEGFYRDVLGLQTARSGEDVEISWPGAVLTLAHRPPTPRGKLQLEFSVDDPQEVDAWAERVRAAGVDIVSGPADLGGVRRLFFLDPDNYEIVIATR